MGTPVDSNWKVWGSVKPSWLQTIELFYLRIPEIKDRRGLSKRTLRVFSNR
jgi:hypothetical protein